jgi:hypothetical protein
MIDANQTYDECFVNSVVKSYSIEWLQIQRGMVDPFVSLFGCRPNSTT